MFQSWILICDFHFFVFVCVTSVRKTRNCAIDFEPCSKLGDLNLDVRKNAKDMNEIDLMENFPRRY